MHAAIELMYKNMLGEFTIGKARAAYIHAFNLVSCIYRGMSVPIYMLKRLDCILAGIVMVLISVLIITIPPHTERT